MNRPNLALFAFWALASSFPNPANAAPETHELDATGLAVIKVESMKGKVTISHGDGPKAVVTADKITFPPSCEMKLERQGSVLLVQNKSHVFESDCNVALDLKVPASVDLDIADGSGNVAVHDIRGKLTFEIGSGNLSAEGQFTELRGMAGSGHVSLHGLTGGGQIKAGSGAIDIAYAALPSSGELTIRTGSGDAHLIFPKGSQIATSFKAGSGQMTNELGDHADAKFKVTMLTGSGNLTIIPAAN